MKKVLCILLSLVMIFSIITIVPQTNVEAKATKKAMKFLKGTWVTAGNSGATKIIFTRKYMKSYDLWNSSYTKVKSPKSTGKYIGKSKIVSTKKKGRKWIIKVKNKNGYTYYKGYGYVLDCWWKEHGKWQYSGSDSLERYSKKVYK